MVSKTNKINFYLIKYQYEIEGIFRDPIDDLSVIEIKEGYSLYYNNKRVNPAPWVSDFFNAEFKEEIGDGERHIFNTASSQAVLVREVTIYGDPHLFAICFGTGYHMLKKDAYEPRFGLLSVLNVVDENSLRRIDKHDISGTPKFTAEQLSQKGGQMDFGLDFELDILLGVTGALDKHLKREKYKHRLFGPALSGKSNLNISAKFNIDNVDRLLRASYVASRMKRYKNKGFDWIDKIELVKKKTSKFDELQAELDNRLADEQDQSKIWLAVPELVEWQDIQSFYFNNEQDHQFEDVSLTELKDFLEPPLSVDLLKSTQVHALHSAGERDAYVWSAYQCLYAEIELNGSSFILINNEWYKLKNDFVTDTNAKYQNILDNHQSDIEFKPYVETHNDENGYNSSMTAEIPDALCMDAKNISHGGRYSKIEFCDIFDVTNKKLIHVKKYSGSSVLSHLFAQGLVSAQLLLDDSEFRTKVEEKIKSPDVGGDYEFDNEISGFEIVYGIIKKPETPEIELPFFSKVNLNNIFARLRNMRGYDVSIAFIDNEAPKKKDTEGND